MDSESDLLQKATLLWDHGQFLATNVDGEQNSLYRFNDNLYVIWYTGENTLEKVGIVDTETAKKMFKRFQG